MQSTEYVIWTNFHAKKTDRDVQAYQLAAMVLDRFGVHDGTILRYHQSHGYDETGSETFQNGLCMLEYDMLYGKHYATGGEMAVQPMELHFGVDEITLTGVSSSDSGLTVHGTNFTPYSVILVDGEQVPTEYIDEQTLAAADTSLSPGEVLAVAQVSATDTLKILSQTPGLDRPGEKIVSNNRTRCGTGKPHRVLLYPYTSSPSSRISCGVARRRTGFVCAGG